MHIIKTNLFCRVGVVLLYGLTACMSDEDKNCPITAQPVTEHDFTVPEEVFYRQKSGAEIYYIAGECFGGNAQAHWEYTGEAEYQNPSNPINSFEFVTGGTLCGQLHSGGGVSEKVCKEVRVLRDKIWGLDHEAFPGGKSKQQVTLTLQGDVYSGFGMFNSWYKFDTVAFDWIQQAAPNLIDFNAFAGFAIGDIGYLVGNNSVLYAYDPSANSWTKKGQLPELVSTILNLGAFARREEYAYPVLGLAAGGKGYFGIGNQNRLFEYTPETNTWKELAPKPEKGQVGDHSFAYNGKLYAGKHVYDIATDTWTKGSDNFSISVGFSPGFVPFKGVMYGGLAGKTVYFDGQSVQPVDIGSANRFVNAPLGLHANGAATGNFIIYPRLMGSIGKEEAFMRFYLHE